MVFAAVQKNARYVNGQKIKPWLRAAGAYSPLGSWKDLAAANTSGNTIYTDADFVKLQQGNPTLYQSEVSGDSPVLRAQVSLDAETAAIRISRAQTSPRSRTSRPTSLWTICGGWPLTTAVLRVNVCTRILNSSGMDATPLAGLLSGEVDAEGARPLA